MLMYVKESRLVGDGLVNLSLNPRTGVVTEKSPIFHRDIDSVYSFRTGRRGLTSTHNGGVYKPRGRNLGDKLRDRKEYIEGIDRSLSSFDGEPIIYSQGRTNAFISIKGRTTGGMFTAERGSRTGSWNPTIRYANHASKINYAVPVAAAGISPASATKLGGVDIPPNLAAMADWGASMHYASNPFRNVTGIGETILEIVSGNVPRITSNLFKLLKDGGLDSLKKAPKAASQDYLNANFGLGPIFQDLLKLLTVGIQLHESLYGTSFRRSRHSPLFSDSWTESNVSTISTGNAFTYNGVGKVPSDGFLVYNGPVGYRDQNLSVEHHYSEDMRFKARFTLARASIFADQKYNQALELVRTYGLWTPKLLWDITPWSWILDWFVHFGRGFVNAFDFGVDGGLKSDYACVTSMTITQTVVPGGYHENRSGNFLWKTWSNSLYTTCRTIVRQPVSPFGTAVDLAKLDQWQKSILIALGIARVK